MIVPLRRRVRVGVVEQGNEKTAHYVAHVEAVGAEVALLHWHDGGDPDADAVAYDALVLCGGDDLHARHFGQDNHSDVELDDERRDLYELAICRTAVEAGVPLLAVCRGVQVLNVALGGALDQHIPDVPGREEHRGGVRHTLRLAQDSWMERLGRNGRPNPRVNSYHHQAVSHVAERLRPTAWAVDGGVEALEGPGEFCLGVQWHPERVGNDARLGRGLFQALVQSAQWS